MAENKYPISINFELLGMEFDAFDSTIHKVVDRWSMIFRCSLCKNEIEFPFYGLGAATRALDEYKKLAELKGWKWISEKWRCPTCSKL